MGRTTMILLAILAAGDFNSLAPYGANLGYQEAWAEYRYISTHSPRMGRTQAQRAFEAVQAISTHSPRMGRTRRDFARSGKHLDFNSLAPYGANPRRKTSI